MNNYKVEIWENGVWKDYTKKAVFPLKYANLLDEQLDEAELSLKRINKEYFNPFIKVRLTLINTPEAKFTENYFNKVVARSQNPLVKFSFNNGIITETLETLFFVANDNSVKIYVDKKYNHDIYLIELTKLLERFIGDSITFTNALGHEYIKE